MRTGSEMPFRFLHDFLEMINIKFVEYRQRIAENEKKNIIDAMKKRYVNTEKEKGLLWNAFIEKTQCYSFEKISSIGIPNTGNIFFYLERQDELYITSLQAIINFVNSFEPWDVIDAYIFDNTMLWIAAITHEDNMLLTIGI